MSAFIGFRGTQPHVSPRVGRLAVITMALGLGLSFGGGTARADQPVSNDGPAGAAQVSLIGDSTLTGVRWYDDYGDLRQYSFLLNAESCRRTIGQSCISREGYRSETVLAAMNTHHGDLGQVLVVMSGYNDPDWTIDDSISLVTEEAREQGVDHVVWLTLRTGDDVDYSDPQQGSSVNSFRLYNEALTEAAAASAGFLQVADWATYSSGATSWFEADGVHLTTQGVDALTSYLARALERVLSGGDVSPDSAPWTVLVPGTEGAIVEGVQSALIDAGTDVPGGADGVYGNDTMAAVAAFQEQSGVLQVTGAVDDATARLLGVHPESGEPADEPDSRGDAQTASESDSATPAPTVTPSAELPANGNSPTVWLVVLAVVIGLVTAALVGRRRYIVSRRRERQRARVHPSTSPHRSVADLRRSGELPAVHLIEEPVTMSDQQAADAPDELRPVHD